MATDQSNPFSTETVIDAVQQAAEFVGQSERNYFRQFAEGCGQSKGFESPIEAVFWIWFEALRSLDSGITCGVYNFDLIPQDRVTMPDGTVFVLDFSIEDFKIAVELDGHDFHERTKEQVAYRNMRDRRLQADGWTVLHISGSELWRAPLDRVEEVYSLCRERALDQNTAKWRAAIAARESTPVASE
jgi:uncharacterized protein DUF559